MNNDEKIRELLEAEEIPEEISPENIKAMLDAQTAVTVSDEEAAKKRSGIRMGGRIAAAAAACALIAGGGAALKNSDMLTKNAEITGPTDAYSEPDKAESEEKRSEDTLTKGMDDKSDVKNGGEKEEEKAETVSAKAESYMSGAKSYDEIYTIFKKGSKKYEKTISRNYETDGLIYEAAIEEEVAEAPNSVNDAAVAGGDENTLGIGGGDEGETHSETFDQEEGVREADIVKTDGKNIYTVHTYDKYMLYDIDPVEEDASRAYLTVAAVDKGDIGEVKQICLNDDIGDIFGPDLTEYVSVQDMYLCNDLIAVVGTVTGWDADTYSKWGYLYSMDRKESVFVSFYTHTDEPEYLGTYYQDGYYSDVRITPDGYMYLLSDYSSVDFASIENAENIERYIPECGTDENGMTCLEPDCILLPDRDFEDYLLRYSVIGSIDLSTPGQYSVCGTKALAGYSGTMYCSTDNIYTADGYEETEITRIAIGGGKIEPAASCRLQGYVLDQFSMSEYNGYFRIATSENRWIVRKNLITDIIGTSGSRHIRNNHLYVLDMDLNTVGSISDFGLDENIKSVNFNGDTAYVVTYRQTDPLFAIDLSTPSAPAIMDELKLPGFSTYMQKWDEGHLLGFGINADENGRQTGVKAVMFDNSDPYDLKEAGFFAINGDDEYKWVWSNGTYDRKALLIAPEKNLFGFPVSINDYNYETGKSGDCSKYVFLSYDGSQFVLEGEITEEFKSNEAQYSFERAVYIGDYIYAISGQKIIAASIDGINVTDSATIAPDLG